jgi:hypothetical protein
MPNNNDADGHKGKEESGYAAASKGASAASVAKLLKGIDFPANKDDIVQRIQQNKGKAEDSADSVIDIINQMADKKYNSMADVEHEVGQIE